MDSVVALKILFLAYGRRGLLERIVNCLAHLDLINRTTDF